MPQEDAEESTEERKKQSQEHVFRKCVEGVDNSDIVVAVLDGVDVDSGTAWEIEFTLTQRKSLL